MIMLCWRLPQKPSCLVHEVKQNIIGNNLKAWKKFAQFWKFAFFIISLHHVKMWVGNELKNRSRREVLVIIRLYAQNFRINFFDKKTKIRGWTTGIKSNYRNWIKAPPSVPFRIRCTLTFDWNFIYWKAFIITNNTKVNRRAVPKSNQQYFGCSVGWRYFFHKLIQDINFILHIVERRNYDASLQSNEFIKMTRIYDACER